MATRVFTHCSGDREQQRAAISDALQPRGGATRYSQDGRHRLIGAPAETYTRGGRRCGPPSAGRDTMQGTRTPYEGEYQPAAIAWRQPGGSVICSTRADAAMLDDVGRQPSRSPRRARNGNASAEAMRPRARRARRQSSARRRASRSLNVRSCTTGCRQPRDSRDDGRDTRVASPSSSNRDVLGRWPSRTSETATRAGSRSALRSSTLSGVVGPRASKQISRVGIGRVDVAAGIDDHRRAIDVVLEAEQVVVLVVAEAAGADDAVGDEQVVVVRAASRSCRRVENGAARRGGAGGARPSRGAIEAPPCRFPFAPLAGTARPVVARRTAPAAGPNRCRGSCGCHGAVSAQDVQPPIVGIADLRHQAVGPQHRRRENRSWRSAERGTAAGSGVPPRVGDARRAEKQFADEPMVRARTTRSRRRRAAPGRPFPARATCGTGGPTARREADRETRPPHRTGRRRC